ncbi:MAG: M99 family carboxypeptidase catalytic domain-containing protein [Helicobacter sp.]|nr:M99 family carboxypeptidase catalytic domain-containing protein [Helicobacter sp.]
MRQIWLALALFGFVFAKPLDFSIISKGPKDSKKNDAPTALVIGGIQGDEPGGFNAVNIFLNHYRITKGRVLAISVLNRHSMLVNSRGLYGDMNRKFNLIEPSDPEFELVNRIKKLILDSKIDIIFHLHDGGGFYRPTFESQIANPNRWGACSIIDQEDLEGAKFPHLGALSKAIISHINAHLLRPNERYYTRNTKTAEGNTEMEKALTYYAIRHKKSAIASEASKNLDLQTRVYYHLLALEALFNEIGIGFERDFKLDPKVLYRLINDKSLDVTIANSIKLPLFGLKSELMYFPLPMNYKNDVENIKLASNSHILGLSDRKNEVFLKYGNRLQTKLKPIYLDFDKDIKTADFIIDGKAQSVQIPSVIKVKKTFEVMPQNGIRVNVIGFVGSKKSEAGYKISKNMLQNRFAIDRSDVMYRVEFYKDEKFAGMVIVDFNK